MAITITVYDANKDGKGINVAAYLANYDKTYTPDGRGGFSRDPVGGPNGLEYRAKQYASYNKSDYGVVLIAGAKELNYSMSTHTIDGSISAVKFGNKIKLNTKTENFEMSPDLTITGLGITKDSSVHNFVADISGGKETEGGATAELLNLLKKDAIVFKGSKGADTFTGFAKADKISGGDGNDVLKGEGGNDTIKGGNGNDTISGGTGNDKLYGDAGNDTIKGGSGNDTIYGGAGNDKLYGDAGNDTVKGDAGNDKIYGGDGVDKLYGGTGNDTLYGGKHNDVLYGDAGNDKLYGDAGNDKLYGGAGNDTLSGGAGNDKLYGGTGNDTLTGGAGNDLFVFKKNEGKDRITDFDAGSAKTDVIQLDKALLKNFSAVLDHTTDTAKGALIEYGKGSILLSGVEKFDLHANDFLFV